MPSTLTIDPVKSLFLAVPYPITTTSFKTVSAASFKVTVIGVFVAGIEAVSRPIIEIFKISPALAFMVKFPSKSVTVEVLDSTAITLAPGSPNPLLSTTFPLIACTCPDI